jgi:hypothetical protein
VKYSWFNMGLEPRFYPTIIFILPFFDVLHGIASLLASFYHCSSTTFLVSQYSEHPLDPLNTSSLKRSLTDLQNAKTDLTCAFTVCLKSVSGATGHMLLATSHTHMLLHTPYTCFLPCVNANISHISPKCHVI